MSVVLVDLGDETHDVMVNNAGWRNTVEVFRSLGILEAERIQQLQTTGLGICPRITQEEAQAIGNALVAGPLSTVNWIGDVYPPPGYFRDASSEKLDYNRDTYWSAWLRTLAGFCLTCKGFIVYRSERNLLDREEAFPHVQTEPSKKAMCYGFPNRPVAAPDSLAHRGLYFRGTIMSLQLVVVAGPDTGKTFTLNVGPNLMLGRSAQAQYVLSDPSVSRNHCQVELQGDEIALRCNSATSGTFVNGKKIQEQRLKPGDVIQVGNTQLRLTLGDLPLDVALAQSTGAMKPLTDSAIRKVEKLATLVGTTLAHYDITLIIGKGHTGLVFHATDTKDNRPVALKVLGPEFSQDEEEMQRFVRGMKTVLPLRHPHLVTLYAAGRTGPYCWMAMEYVAGENLQQVIDRIGVAGMLDWRHAFQVTWQIGHALDYAHEQGILHRNVTPTNILRVATDKTVKLGDLMLAKALEGPMARQVTRPGELLGDVAYMSPERTRGTTDLDVRSDLYGLGATVYALLTGKPPVTGTTLVEKIARIRQTEPESPKKFQMATPASFEGVVMKLLAKQPEQRYQTPKALIADLQRIARPLGVTVSAPAAG